MSRCLPCLKSLIPDSRLSIHSRPPHCAMTPAILYTSSSSSSSSVIRSGKTFYSSIVMRYCTFSFSITVPRQYWLQANVMAKSMSATLVNSINICDYITHIRLRHMWASYVWLVLTHCKLTVNLTCGWVQWLYELLSGISQQTSHSIDDSHWLTLGGKKRLCD